MATEVDLSRIYTPREWELSDVSMEEFVAFIDKTDTAYDLQCCSSDGVFAQKFYERNRNINHLFFIDQEQIVMGMDRQYGIHSLRLFADGEKVRLALCFYKGADQGRATIALEIL